MNAAFDSLAERVVKEHWDFYPTAGSRIGRHEYDGQLPDLSPHRITRRVEELRRGLAQLSGLADGNSRAGTGEPEDRLTYRLLELFLRRELFNLEEMRTLENNPMRQVGYLNVGGYVKRDYAPLVDRLRSATEAMEQVPDFLNVVDAALAPELSRPVLEMSIESYRGMARFYRVDLGVDPDQSGSDVNDAETLAKFDQAREQAARALDGFVVKLEERLARMPEGAEGDFAIGSQLYSDMLAYGEGVNVPLRDIIELGQANMERNLERLAEATAAVGPGRSIRDIVGEIGRNHPAAEALIPETRAMLEDIRQSLLDHDIISLPAEDRCQVIETPTYMRYAFAAMDSPGSLETRSTESYYYVTPVEETWTDAQAEEWLSNFNYDTLRIISIHEVYPGHFVHHLHNSYGRPLPLVNRVASSYAFTEGWAHYTEEMMLETEYARGQAALRVTQLLEALVRNCRYLCALGMHTQGMTVDEATRFFMDNAYMEELPARREALRGTFDPGYLNYTLGKLMILKLREDYRREQGSAYTLKGFHDRLLSYGAPPLPLLREVMLANPGDGPL
ncbi:MAG: DUF885 domain-containing protein [Chloroflexi bacterium]|nr:DUF885 domain-containing protein [Chloroflexota bacterium]